jgi:chemotaxis protein CheY-P-specific phosphatase CheC
MAARMRKTHQDDVREKIQASQIINRLSGHLNGEVELSTTQVRAAEILLKKTLPDLSSVDFDGTVNVRKSAAELSDDELAAMADAGRQPQA